MKAWPVRSSATPRDGHLRFGRVHRGQLLATELLLAPRLGGQDAVARSDRRPRGRRVAPPGLEPGLPNPEPSPAGLFGGHHVRKWLPAKHRRPQARGAMPGLARRNACKTLVESSATLLLNVGQERYRLTPIFARLERRIPEPPAGKRAAA